MKALLSRVKGDKVIWAVVILLSLLSMLAVYSATRSLAWRSDKNSSYFLVKQIFVLASGMGITILSHSINYTKYSRFAVILYIISIPLLIYTLAYGTTLNEGSRWIKIPLIGITFQTSDLAKLALFLFLARTLSKKQNEIKDFQKGFLHLLVPVLVTCFLIAIANLSTALLLGTTCSILFYIGRARGKHILLLIGLGIVGVLLIFTISKLTGIGRGATWEKRIETFMGKGEQDSDDTYQTDQAKIAIANGGLIGTGPGNSYARDFLPHPYSDFIFAIIIEEYGLIGASIVVFLYLLFLWRCIMIFTRCPYAFGAFLSLGLSFTLVFQALLNMAVNVNLVPVTGLTLPLISMGGSSIWFNSIAIGIILSVSRYVDQEEQKKSAEAIKTEEAEAEAELAISH